MKRSLVGPTIQPHVVYGSQNLMTKPSRFGERSRSRANKIYKNGGFMRVCGLLKYRKAAPRANVRHDDKHF